MAKKEKRLSKREKRDLAPRMAATHKHIHCISCGRHIDEKEFTASPVTARFVSCLHGSKHPTCVGCVGASQRLLDEHDRTGQPVRVTAAWH